MESLFPWSKIDDKEFEEVTLEVAERSMPGSNFSLYLKKGHAQEGIDIKSALIDGKYICIQCKHVKELTTTLLDKIIELFLAKDFRQRASKFILATTTDLQTPRLQRHLQVWERKLFQEHGISFEYWDVNFIEQSLRYQHSVVKFYFGPATAQKHCYEQIRPESIPTRSEEKQFIPRRIVPFLQTSDSRFPEWHPDRGKEIDMVSLFEGPKRLQPKLIGLIADAHQGKSVLFRQTAYALENINIPFTSLFLELKWQNIGPIGEMLTSVYANWQEVPAKDTVIFIDGLDEAPADKFLEAARHIVAFARENRRTSIVFSCRRVFFNSYRLQEEMGAFDLYELPGLNSFDVEQYIERQLQSRHRSFMKFVREAGIQMLLHEPFYVNTLINQFNETPNKQPKTKINILKKVIANSFKHSDSRQIRSGRKIHQQSVLATKVIENFAFALQLGGNNSLSDDEVQILFEENKRELLENSSLVTIQNGKWSLTNAIFQEHLAAMVLVEFPFEKIVSLVADGATQKKIKTKWIQTISSLLFLLEDKKLYNQILRFVEDDNIELIFLTDPSKYDNTLKADMLERLIQRFQTYRIRPMITNEETIAVFIQSSQPAVEFLLTVLKGEYAVVVKTVAIRVLKYLTLNNNQKQAIYTLARVELPQTTYDNYANLLMEVLVINELGDEHFIQSLIEDGKLNNSHEYRSGVYRLIVTFNLSDRFCDYLFSGIEALIRHNSQIIRSNSGYWFELAVSKFKTPQNIKRLLGLFLSAPWQNYYEGATAKDFLSQILSNIAKVYSQDPTVVFPVIAFVKSLGDEYRKNTYTVVDEFFEKTGTSTLAVRLLQKEIFSDKQWLLGGLVTEDSFDFILDVVEEEEKYFPNRLRLIIKALQYRNKQILSQKFLTLVDEAYEGNFLGT